MENQDPNTLKTLAERLVWARTRKDWTQPHLATVAGVSTSTVGMIETGQRQNKGSLPALAEALGVRHKWLLAGEGPVEPENIKTLDEALKAGTVTAVPMGRTTVRKWRPEDPERLVRQFEALLLRLPEEHRLAAANAAYGAMTQFLLGLPTPEQDPPGP